MQQLEHIIRDIAALLSVSTLVIEAGFLLLLTALILAFVLVLEAIISIRKEMIKFSWGANYIAGLLTRGFEEAKISSGTFDFNPSEWQEDTREIVLMMLQEGKSYGEIQSKLRVSESYIKGVIK